MDKQWVNIGVRPAKILNGPQLATTVWFKQWAVECGNCNREFETFKWFTTKLRCPFCAVINLPELTWYP